MRTSPTVKRAGAVARRRVRPRGVGLATLLATVASLASACGEPSRPAARATAAAGAIRFEEVAESAGLRFRMAFLPGEQGERFKINLYDHGCGVAVADVDGDGDEDVYFCNQLGRNALFLNDGHARFTDVTERAGVGLGDRICVGATFGDLDGDGDLDLFVTSTRGGNVCFRNRGDGTFEDVTRASGLELVAHAQQPACFDADGDGDLDLFVPCTAGWTTEDRDPAGRYYTGVATIDAIRYSPLEHDRFYRNRGDGVFVDATTEAGFDGTGWGSDPAVLDLEGDGDLDLYVARMFGRSTLYRNDGRGRFTDVTLATLGRTPGGAVGAKVFDADGDGRLDLYTVDMHSDMWMAPGFDPTSVPESFRRPLSAPEPGAPPTPFTLRPDEIVNGNTLHVALPDGRFEDRSLVLAAETLWPWGIAVADFDADGWEDVFLPSGMGYPFVYWRSPLLRSVGGVRFEDVARSAGLDPPPGGPDLPEPIGGKPAPRSHRSAATADFDGDGRVDLVANPFNDRAYLYLNRSPERPWVGFRLVDDGRVKAAVGAVVRVTVGRRTLVRQVQAAGGYLAQSSQVLHFGLGGATTIDRVEVRWPRGRTQVLTGVEPGRVHTLTPPR
ncbi:MAG: CRTAC1 family protein [Planctomycetota bacterium]